MSSMTREELLKLHEVTCAAARSMMERKNRDYAGGTGGCFTNFMACEVLGVRAEIGILMRCMDKFQRLRAFINTGELHVKNEGFEDAIEDVINYMILLKGLLIERDPTQGPLPPGTVVPMDEKCFVDMQRTLETIGSSGLNAQSE